MRVLNVLSVVSFPVSFKRILLFRVSRQCFLCSLVCQFIANLSVFVVMITTFLMIIILFFHQIICLHLSEMSSQTSFSVKSSYLSLYLYLPDSFLLVILFLSLSLFFTRCKFEIVCESKSFCVVCSSVWCLPSWRCFLSSECPERRWENGLKFWHFLITNRTSELLKQKETLSSPSGILWRRRRRRRRRGLVSHETRKKGILIWPNHGYEDNAKT